MMQVKSFCAVVALAWPTFLFPAFGCHRGPRVPAATPDLPGLPDAPRPAEVHAVFTSPDGRRSEFWLEVADTPQARARGLMFRRDLAPDRGMVFVFPRDDIQTFYMKNTYIPLDMIFVGSDLRVVGVVEDARPLTLDIRSVDRPSRYVVEVRAFTAAARGIVPGSTVRFEPPPGPVPR